MKKRLFVSYLCLLLVGSTCFAPKATLGKSPLVKKMTAVWCDTKQICWEKAKNNPLITLLACYSFIASLTTLWNWRYKKVYKEQNRKRQEEVKKLKKNQSNSLVFNLNSKALIEQNVQTKKNLHEAPKLLKDIEKLFKDCLKSNQSLIQDIKQKEKIQKIINEQNEKHEKEKKDLIKKHKEETDKLKNEHKKNVQKLNEEKENLKKAHETEKENLENEHKKKRSGTEQRKRGVNKGFRSCKNIKRQCREIFS